MQMLQVLPNTEGKGKVPESLGHKQVIAKEALLRAPVAVKGSCYAGEYPMRPDGNKIIKWQAGYF